MAVDATTDQVRWAPPRLAIIVLPFRLGASGLEAAYLREPGGDRLMSAVPGPGEPLDDAAQRISHEKFGRSPQYVEQLYTFDSRPGAAREVVVSYLALFRQDALEPSAGDGMRWSDVTSISLNEAVHRDVFDYGLMRLKAKFGYTNIAFHLLPESFTLSDLQLAYEEVLGHPVDKRNFRRRMASSTILERTGEMRRDGSHRPAALYRFATRDDQAAYLTPSWAAASLSSSSQDDDEP
jgi:8-oxo-dGTP diphosphatase